ncbi:hypothetical protein ACP26F_00365 [Franconibacter pulveris 1160]|jgi:hypothetical protein|uniref:Type VI secretion system-associated protein n=2 Tax=Franconibacter TaxID=1649295 RepID=A0A0J8VPW7_9ENTR|nr:MULTISPECIES: hypothetical protein [Franconibacter]KMV35498.1 hypothetical protein ACH50_06235 [Franconibacter pulveris]MCK1970648.1 hypothetical protein [Franconibacter sp. IITDAS19]MEB5924339.1 hypothetical protein [Franconibacter daqui]GGD36710.1 hypothetical protein GCM10011513_38110 [Franconibacter daqui]
MKFWLPGLALLALSAAAQAENYRIVQSPSQKLDVWIDDLADNTPQSWCAKELPLRIVANGDKRPVLLKTFMPRLGALLENQCAELAVVRWQFTSPEGDLLAQGTASKTADWTPVVLPAAAADTAGEAAPTGRPEDLSPLADRTPWLEFTLQDGCHLRTFWQDNASVPAIFIPAKADGKCEKGGWLNGSSEVVQVSHNTQKKMTMTFVHGFPVSGLNTQADADSLLITTVNNERMVVSDGRANQSWMILPYSAELNGWLADGTVAVEMSRAQASDDARLRARLEAIRKVWSGYLEPGASLKILLVDSLSPLLRDPAAGAYRVVK